MDLELSPAATSIVTVVAVSVMLCSLTAWIVLLARLWHRQPMMSFRPRRPVPWGPVHVALIAVIYIGLEIAAATWVATRAGVMIGQGDSTEALDLQWMPVLLGATAAAKVMALAIGVGVLVLTAGANGNDLGFGTKKLVGQALLGFAAFLTIAPPVFAIQALVSSVVPYKHPVIELLKQDAGIGNLLITTVLAVLVAPLVEEFLFRLVLQGWLQRLEWFNRGGPQRAAVLAAQNAELIEAMLVDAEPAETGSVDDRSSPENPFASPAALTEEPLSRETVDDPNDVPMRPILPLLGVVPICISSLIFAMLHIGQGAAPIPLFVLALGLGYLYWRTGQLLPCIIVHMLLNGTSMALLWLSIYSPA